MQLTVTFALSLVDSEILHTPVLFRLKFRGGCCRSMMLGCAKSEDPRLIAAKLYYENSNLCDRCWFSLGCGLWWRFISQPVRPIRSIWHCYHAVCYPVPQGSVLRPVLFLLLSSSCWCARHSRPYADDIHLYLHSSSDNCKAIFTRLMSCTSIDDVGHWVCSNRLKFNAGKHSLLVLVCEITRPFS